MTITKIYQADLCGQDTVIIAVFLHGFLTVVMEKTTLLIHQLDICQKMVLSTLMVLQIATKRHSQKSQKLIKKDGSKNVRIFVKIIIQNSENICQKNCQLVWT